MTLHQFALVFVFYIVPALAVNHFIVPKTKDWNTQVTYWLLIFVPIANLVALIKLVITTIVIYRRNNLTISKENLKTKL
jgi:hypothetical protein